MFGVEGNTGHDEVDVGVMLDLAAPGMKDAGEAKLGSVDLGGTDVLEGGGALAKDEWVEDFRVKQTKDTEFLRQREGDHEVGYGQKPGFLFGGPDLLVKGSAARAGAVVTTVISELFFLAAITLIEPPTKGGRAARENAPHGPVMVVGELVPVGLGVGFPMLTEEVCEIESHRCGCRRGVL